MLYDLNVPWSSTNAGDVQRTISFLSELRYSVLALTHNVTGAIPAQIINPIPTTLSFPVPATTTILRRCTLIISDPSLNHRLSALASAYDILALRPTTEKAFLAACNTLDNHSIISLDLTIRYPFHFRQKQFMTAIRRGIRFEICYAQAIQDAGAEKRRNFISNTLAIVRATRGRGLLVSSGATGVLGVRAPADVGNLLAVWGVDRERAKEAMTVGPRSVVVNEGMKRRGYRGVIDVVDGGERDVGALEREQEAKKGGGKADVLGRGKRKINTSANESTPGTAPVSKRQAKRLRLAALNAQNGVSSMHASLGSTSMANEHAEKALDTPEAAESGTKA